MDLFERIRNTPTVARAAGLRASGLYPYFRAISENQGATHVVVHGRRLVMAGSNNYLGLTHDPRVIEAFASIPRARLSDIGRHCESRPSLAGERPAGSPALEVVAGNPSVPAD